MFKRIGLFLATNILIILTVSVISYVFGLDRYMGQGGLQNLFVFCVVWGFAGAFISLALSRIIAKWSTGAKVIDPHTTQPDLKWLVNCVHDHARLAGIKTMPEVAVYNSPEMNAFATGPTRNRALVAVSTGLLDRMDRDEIDGVLAHEIGHVSNGDMVTMTLIQAVVNVFVMFFARVVAGFITSNMKGSGRAMVHLVLVIALQILFGILGSIIVAYFSRQREFRADAAGAQLAGKEKMIAALESLKHSIAPLDLANEKGLAALKISGRTPKFLKLFATHPPLDERIAALQ
ncbi:MAG: protease HtpX [Deltaproteobacteria bacterium CG11_big_fil_rev_8_21_14_0_20_45_16]|nr:MAG: protease HtpX [Deltaproteobacteria bacterium CG11_big_fil_rev_8_21_14_0_20_45_16]